LVGDGEDISAAVNVQFDIIWRHGGTDIVLASTTHTFGPPIVAFNASPFATDLAGAAAPADPGDKLVLRFTTLSGATYTPNRARPRPSAPRPDPPPPRVTAGALARPPAVGSGASFPAEVAAAAAAPVAARSAALATVTPPIATTGIGATARTTSASAARPCTG